MTNQQTESYHILFVCTGNSCRSPMAEGLLKSLLPENLRDHVVVRSAGTLGLSGNRATPFAIVAAQKKGSNISSHRSRAITEKLIKEADIIFALDEGHKQFLITQFPSVKENVFLLKEEVRIAAHDGRLSRAVMDDDGAGVDQVVERRSVPVGEDLGTVRGDEG